MMTRHSTTRNEGNMPDNKHAEYHGEITGRVTDIVRETVGAKSTTKVTLTLGMVPQWQGDKDQFINVEFFGRAANSVPANLTAGATVEIGFNLRGREYNGRVYTSVSGQSIRVVGAAAGAADTSADENGSEREQPCDGTLPF
jgi:single-stranded DNA-binding protein